MRTFLLAAILASGTAAAEPGTALNDIAHNARSMGDCRRQTAIQHAHSVPLPVKTPEGLRWRMLYYNAKSTEGERGQVTNVYLPGGVAQFDITGTTVTCSVIVAFPRRDLKTIFEPLGLASPPELKAQGYEAYEKRKMEVYAALEVLGPAYYSGTKAPKEAKAFQKLFDSFAEPGLAKYYPVLSPGFWEWLKKDAR